MSRLSTITSLGDPQDHATNSTHTNNAKQMQQEKSANQISTSSPLTNDDAADLLKHGPSTLDKAGANSLNGSGNGFPLSDLANAVASEVNSPSPQVIDAISQAVSNFGPLSTTSNSISNLPTTPNNFDPLTQASSPLTRSGASASNDISSLLSPFSTNPSSLQQGKPLRKEKLAPDLTPDLKTLPLDPPQTLDSSDIGSYQKGQSQKKTKDSQWQPDPNRIAAKVGDQKDQSASTFEPLLATSNSNDKTHKTTSPDPLNAASINPTRHADQLTRSQTTKPAWITQENNIDSDTEDKSSLSSLFPSSLSSLFPANLTTSHQGDATAKGKPTRNDDSEWQGSPVGFPGSFDPSVTNSYENDQTPKQVGKSPSQDTPKTTKTREESTPQSTSLHEKPTNNEEPDLRDVLVDLPGSFNSSVTNSYENDGKSQNVDKSQWQTSPKTTTTREEYNSQKKEEFDQKTSVTSSSYPAETSVGSTASRVPAMKMPAGQTSQVSPSGATSGNGLDSITPFLGIIPSLNNTLSNLTSPVHLASPCQIALDPKVSNTQPTPQISCYNSSEPFGSNKTGVANLKSPVALQQSSRYSSGYSTKGDLNNVAPIPKNVGKLNDAKNFYNTSMYSEPKVDSKTIKALSSDTTNDPQLSSSNFSSSITASSKQASSLRTESSQNISNPLVVTAPGNKNLKSTADLSQALAKGISLNSSNVAFGGLGSTQSLDKGSPPKLLDLSLDGPSILNNSTRDPLLQASLSSSTSTNMRTKETQDQTRTVSDSKGPFLNSEISTMDNNKQESSFKEKTSNEWRISVQNSSSGFSGQRVAKESNRAHPQLLQEAKRIGSQNSTQSFNITQSRTTSQQLDSSQLGKSMRNSTNTQTNTRSSAHSQSSSSEISSTTPFSKAEDVNSSSDKSPTSSSSWIGQTLLPSSSPSQEQGYHVTSGGKITVISVGLGFSIGVLVLALVGGLMKRRMLRNHRKPDLEISRPKSQLVEDLDSSFSSPRASNIEEGTYAPHPSFEPEYQIPRDDEARMDPFRTSYQMNPAGLRDRYDSYATSFGNCAPPRPDRIEEADYSNQFASYPQEYLGPGPPARISEGTSVIPITFNQRQFGGNDPGRLGALEFENEYYGQPEHLPHSGTPWIPHQQQLDDDCETEVATRFTSDGETMIEGGNDVPPVPPLNWDRQQSYR